MLGVDVRHVSKADSPDFQVREMVDGELTRLFPLRHVKKILFVAPPDADRDMFHYLTGKRGRYWNFPPYGVGSIATHLRQEGLQVDILNLNHEVLKACVHAPDEASFSFDDVWQEALARKIREFSPDMVGVTCMFTQTNRSAKNVCDALKRFAPGIPLALGGVHPTNCLVNDKLAPIFLADFARVDFFFLYEGELAFKQFIRVVNRVAGAEDLCQVFFNSLKPQVYFSDKKIPASEDLDALPAHDLMVPQELSCYGTIGGFYSLKKPGARLTTALFNRGCRGQCTYCSVRNFNGSGVRGRSIASVIGELVLLNEKYGINHVMWLDDDFLKDEDRVIALFDALIEKNLGLTWDCTNGVIASSCTEKVIAKAADAGCIGLTVGMESGNPEILRRIRKPGTVAAFLAAAAVLRRHERINARVFLMIGFPGETYRQILDTINVAQQMDLDWYNITILQPLPNTPLFEAMVRQGFLTDVNLQEIRYNAGPYGKQRKNVEQKKDFVRSSFKDAFSGVDLDSVPPAEALDDIWAYMNYHLNFKRLLHVKSTVKLMQQYGYVKNITDLVAPESAFAMYFCAYLQKKIHGEIEPGLIQRLRHRLRESAYWAGRFADFGLSPDQLEKV